MKNTSTWRKFIKIKTFCLKCTHDAFDNIDVDNGLSAFDTHGFEQVRDDGIYRYDCAKGHNNLTVLRGHHFEILFEIGVKAILDGYYREAVTSFASARERFFEFYIQFMCEKNQVPFETFWKPLKKLSERQLGAFVMIYYLENKKPYAFIDQDIASFRNDVIHQGKIPNIEEAKDFGTFIYNSIVDTLNDLKINQLEALKSMSDALVKKRQEIAIKRHPEFDKTTTTEAGLTLSFKQPQFGTWKFEDVMRHRAIFHGK